MVTYKTAMNVFGLPRGATFEGDPEHWDPMVSAGLLVKVSEDEEEKFPFDALEDGQEVPSP